MSSTIRCLVIDLPSARIAERNQRLSEAISITYSQLPNFLPLPPNLELVVAPLFSKGFDAMDLIDLFGAKGYRGNVRIVAPALPNRNVVLRELRSHAVRSGITVEMVDEE
ncbi:MAG TPA: hypothetical protein PKA03_15840 [Tabrizicola sp.]|nr:hypothetical protein [Tabrizicola sp.]